MQKVLLGFLLFALGAGAGALLANNLQDGGKDRTLRQDSAGDREGITLKAADDQALIARLRAELEQARAALASRATAEDNPYPNDSLDAIEQLMDDALAENNVDWLIEVIERLLLMGEPGYPMLRRLIEGANPVHLAPDVPAAYRQVWEAVMRGLSEEGQDD